jgi:hypothetical protein
LHPAGKISPAGGDRFHQLAAIVFTSWWAVGRRPPTMNHRQWTAVQGIRCGFPVSLGMGQGPRAALFNCESQGKDV